MRDLVFVVFFIIILALSFRKPFVVISLWLWSGIFVPIYWLYGFGEAIKYNIIFSTVGIFSYLIFEKNKSIKMDALFILIMIFFLHTTLTSMTTIVNPVITWISWENFAKALVLFFFIVLVFKTKTHFHLIIWMCVLSVGFFGLIEALKFIASGGGHHIHGPFGHILGDNNHLALAMLMIIPLIIYLISETSEKWLKIGLIVIVSLCILAVLGTKSRGGFVGLLSIGGYFWLKSKRKILVLIAFASFTFLASNILSDSWFSRMETIQSADEDGSFKTRMASWKIHTLMAMERPVLGGGFKAAQYGYVWRSLAVDFHKLDFIPTGPPGDKGWAAHSIYFQVLGDHGFVGLFLFLLILVFAFVKLSSIEKYFKGQWQDKLAKMIKVSIVAFCFSGAAVSMAYFELYYVLLALVTCLSVCRNTVPLNVDKHT